MSNQRRLTVTMLTLGVLASPLPAQAQDTGAQTVLEVGVRTLNAEGSRARNAGIARVLKPGETASSTLQAGRIENPEGELCSMRAADTTGREMNDFDKKWLASALYVWKVTTTGVTVEGGRQTVDVEWQRFDRGSTTAAISGKSRLTLTEEQPHALDLVHGTAAAPCRTPAAILEVTARTREDAALADTVLRYDMWLVRQDRSGKKETRHLILSGVHGAAPDFHFSPLLTAVAKLQPDQYDFRVATRVAGAVRGRLTRDGQVSIELETHRSDRVERVPPSSSTLPPRAAGGRKVLTGALGEAIEIQLPPAAGSSSSFASENSETDAKAQRGKGVAADPPGAPGTRRTAAPTEPVLIQNGRLVVNYAAFFEGERLSVIVQVRKADAGGEEPPLR